MVEGYRLDPAYTILGAIVGLGK